MESREGDIPISQLFESFRASRHNAHATARSDEAKAMKCVLAPALEHVAAAAEKIEKDPQALEETAAALRKLVAEKRASSDFGQDNPFQGSRETGTIELARRTHIDWEQVGRPPEES